MKIHRSVLVLALALVAGLMATALAARWLLARSDQTASVVVAAADIPLGTPLEASMLTTVAWPPGRMPEGAAPDPGALLGRVTRSALTRHEPVLEGKLAAAGARGGLAAAIAPGKRALTVKVNEIMGVAGFALPGSLVDVMVHTRLDEARRSDGASMSKIVLERILVLAVAQESSREATAPKVAAAVTLEVTPEQAERLDLARSVGALSLALRNPADTEDAQTTGARKGDLWASAAAAPAPIEAAPSRLEPPRAHRPSADRPAPRPQPSAASAHPAEHAPQGSAEVMRGLQRSTTVW